MLLKQIKNSRGMTLIEIMIVVTILASLGAILATQVVKQGEKAKLREAKIQIGEISKALDMYYTDCGHYPDSSQGLAALAPGGESTCTNWGPEPYLKKLPMDPWNHPFDYTLDGGNYTITSHGRDGNSNITNE